MLVTELTTLLLPVYYRRKKPKAEKIHAFCNTRTLSQSCAQKETITEVTRTCVYMNANNTAANVFVVQITFDAFR